MKALLFTLCGLLLLPFPGRGVNPQPILAITNEHVGTLRAWHNSSHPVAGVVIWSDGLVIWSRDHNSGGVGPPYFFTQLDPSRVAPLIALFARDHVFDEQSFRHSWATPNSDIATLWLRSGPRETHLNLNLSSEGRGAFETKEYREFRRVWDDLRNAAAALVPALGEGYKGSPFTHPSPP